MMNAGAVNASSPTFSRCASVTSLDPTFAATALAEPAAVPGGFHAGDEPLARAGFSVQKWRRQRLYRRPFSELPPAADERHSAGRRRRSVTATLEQAAARCRELADTLAPPRIATRSGTPGTPAHDALVIAAMLKNFAVRCATAAEASAARTASDETIFEGLLSDAVPLCSEASELPSILPDVDELVHGLYAFYVKLHAFNQTDSSSFLAEGVDESQRLRADAVNALRSPDSAHPQAVGLIDVLANSLTCVGATMAIVGGCREMRDARALERNVKAELRRTEAAMQQNVEQRLPASPLRRLAQNWLERGTADLQRARQTNRWTMRIGIGSFGSGVSLLGKAGLELGTQVGLTVAAKGAAIGAFVAANKAAAVVALITGGACALVLGPLAGVFAAVMGIAFVTQSSRELRNRRSDMRRYQSLSGGRHAVGGYGAFLMGKLAARMRFLKAFHCGNWRFASSAGLYATSAVAKAAVWVAALALGAAASPLLLNVLLFGGLCGGLIMGLASLQFLYKHPQHKRYATYATESDPHMLRDVMAAAALIDRELRAPGMASSAMPADMSGSALTQGCFEMFECKEAARQRLLTTAAVSCDKHYVPRLRSEQKLPGAAKPANRGVRQQGRVRRNVGALGRAARTLLTGGGWRASRDAWRMQRANLSELAFYRWLDAPAALAAQCDYMDASLKAQAKHFDALWQRLHQWDVATRSARDDLLGKRLTALSDVDRADPLVRLRLNQLKVQATLRVTVSLLADVAKLRAMARAQVRDEHGIAASLKQCRERFTGLQQRMVGTHAADGLDGLNAADECVAPAADETERIDAAGRASIDVNANAYVRQTTEMLHREGVARRFARLCVREEKHRWTRVRGILPEVELQAARWATRAPV